MQLCKELSHGIKCNQQCTNVVDKSSPVRRVIIMTGRKNWSGGPELSYHMIHDSYPIMSGLCYYHEKIRLGLIDDPNKIRPWRK